MQSFKASAYQPIHLDMLRTLAAYTAIALDNADSYDALARSQQAVASLLDNSGEGFLSFGKDRLIDAAYSRACDGMLGGSRVLENGHLMVVLADITAARRLAAQVAEEHGRLQMILAAVSDSRDFFHAVEAFHRFAREGLGRLLALPAASSEVLRFVYREIHTHKGTLAQFALKKTATALHELEGELDALSGSMT